MDELSGNVVYCKIGVAYCAIRVAYCAMFFVMKFENMYFSKFEHHDAGTYVITIPPIAPVYQQIYNLLSRMYVHT